METTTESPPVPAAAQNFPCKQCGAQLTFEAGADQQSCQYCGFAIEIPKSEDDIKELDFEAYVAKALNDTNQEEVALTKCETCGAESSINPNLTARDCPFCGSVQIREESRRLLKPASLLPFAVDKKAASGKFRAWIASRWFAPNKLKHIDSLSGGLNGMYVPYWTYDSYTTTYYRGQRGVAYYVTESYTTTENGKSVSKTRQVRKIRWYPASGTVFLQFDDVLVNASNSLPKEYADRLEPWDLENLTNYDTKYLSGFRAESYQIDLPTGFKEAKVKMEPRIRTVIRADIGGDEQRITSMSTGYDNVTFKHCLLPIWISAYQYQKKVWRVLVNGRTGEVQGERPYSWVKIAATVITVGAICGAIYYFGNR